MNTKGMLRKLMSPMLIFALLFGMVAAYPGMFSYAAEQTVPQLETLSISPETVISKSEANAQIYAASLPADTKTIKVKVTSKSKSDWLIIEGSPVAQGVFSPAITLKASNQWIEIQLISADGKLSSRYRLLVGRALSNNANLESIQVGSEKAEFLTEKNCYQINLPANIEEAQITLKTQDSSSQVFYNGQALMSGNMVIQPQAGPNLYEFAVVAENGEQSIHRLAVFVAEPKSDASLKGFMVTAGGKIAKGSEADLTSLAIVAEPGVKGIKVKIGPADVNAVVKINGVAITPNQTSPLIYVPVGKSTIDVSITAQDGISMQSYTIPVEKSASGTQSSVSFADMKNHPLQNPVSELAKSGILSGTKGQRFSPNQGITQAEYAVILAKVFGLSPQTKTPIEGLNPKAWYASAVYACNDATGNDLWGGTAFSGNAALTKAEAIKLFMALYNHQIVETGAVNALSEDEFFDFSTAKNTPLTRAEAADLVYRFMVALRWL